MSPLRFLTYLSPSLPLGLFEAVADVVGRRLGVDTALASETEVSGPAADGSDPFTTRTADIGFCCGPTFAWLRARRPSPVRLVPAAPVFADTRAGGRPVYYADVVVRTGTSAARFDDLRGMRWGYNDPHSLSGYFCVLERLRAMGETTRFFGAAIHAGSHVEALRMIRAGELDCAAVDSTALLLAARRDPTLAGELRVVESFGPYPVQPVVARAGLSPAVRASIAEALLSAHRDPVAGPALAGFGVTRFARTDEGAYADELVGLHRPVSKTGGSYRAACA